MTDAHMLPLTSARITFPSVDLESTELELDEPRSPWGEVSYRYFGVEPGEPLESAVERLARTVPEIPSLALETIGGADGVRVLRSGDHRVALDEGHSPSAAVARAANALLSHIAETFRFVPLRAGGEQGLYAAATAEESVELLHADLLAVDGLAELFDLACF